MQTESGLNSWPPTICAFKIKLERQYIKVQRVFKGHRPNVHITHNSRPEPKEALHPSHEMAAIRNYFEPERACRPDRN